MKLKNHISHVQRVNQKIFEGSKNLTHKNRLIEVNKEFLHKLIYSSNECRIKDQPILPNDRKGLYNFSTKNWNGRKRCEQVYMLGGLLCHVIQGESWALSVSTNVRLLFTYEDIHWELLHFPNSTTSSRVQMVFQNGTSRLCSLKLFLSAVIIWSNTYLYALPHIP